MSPSLLNLEEMAIVDCESLEEVFELGEAGEGSSEVKELPLLSSLKRLELEGLPELKCIRKGPIRHVSLRSLAHLQLRSLHKMTFIFTPHLAQSLVHLETIRIEYCSGLKHLISEKDDEREIIPDSLGFPKLRTLYIRDCEKLEYVFPVSMSPSLLNLEEMAIVDRESLEEVFELGEAGEGSSEVKELPLLSSLKRLELEGLPELKCIWKGPIRHVSLRSLAHLQLRSLHKMTFIFTLHLAQSLAHLETIRIEYCSGLKHLISEKDDEREIIPDSLGFPKLKTLYIRDCEKLEYVFPVSVSPSLQNLEEIKIDYGCNLKQIFYSGEGDAHTSNGVINFPRLREFSLPSCCNFFGPKNFTVQLPYLQLLYIKGHEELGDLLTKLQISYCKGAQDRRTGHELSLLSLEKLYLWSLPDMRCIWKGLVLSHLTTLVVCDCETLTHVFTGSMVASLVQLQFLGITGCEELEQIIAKDNDDEKDLQSLCFPNLCKVQIYQCSKLRSLFPVDMASGLPKLKKLRVVDSSQLLGVFWQDDDAAPVNVEKQMVLPNLSFLRLHNLPSIVCFSLGCDDFLFPRPEMLLMVDECPKLTTKFTRKTNGSTSAQSEVSQSI